jgi:N-acetylneuraminate synthase
VRNTEAAIGNGDKRVLDIEQELYEKARRAIHAVTDIEAGATLTEDNTAVLRPGEREAGLQSRHYEDVLGTTAARRIREGEGIRPEALSDYDS